MRWRSNMRPLPSGASWSAPIAPALPLPDPCNYSNELTFGMYVRSKCCMHVRARCRWRIFSALQREAPGTSPHFARAHYGLKKRFLIRNANGSGPHRSTKQEAPAAHIMNNCAGATPAAVRQFVGIPGRKAPELVPAAVRQFMGSPRACVKTKTPLFNFPRRSAV